ncbi:MAG: ATP-dependent proteinase, Serine peptidase, MEROPS family S16 [Candidatus Roizmanbacteria bacterium GW2011_GWC2_41_7]|uniref:ATP-dependent proteinase, Serine peptidase, MEROPS family S16 n=1 Tax=Candidatus Roizmanbacteria bacterium GW2011_GWC2_41_7 TaxID=1618487 RepID=A0A0G0X261_9BACT|nr:MAG: ATP-dependent proteinase, Serine peptidase, MEROPS family S16 [Candidatus Roizmanbacteria bacterium GW2011_GWC2_41_7]
MTPQTLNQKLTAAHIPPDLIDKIEQMTAQSKSNPLLVEPTQKYINMMLSLPWDAVTRDTLDLSGARAILDKHHYGMGVIKDRILEYLSVLALKARGQKEGSRAPILFFVGLVGTGKTTLAKAISEAMGRRYARIPFGGMGSALDLRGQSRVHPDAEPGQLIKALIRDRVAESTRADIMGVLVELLDPEQNVRFVDHYLDYPFDLSQVLFIATANNTKNIATAVLDRLEVIQMPSYSDEEKTAIGRDYVFPKQLTATGLSNETLIIASDVWPLIVRPLGFDAGIRTLERTINAVCRKVAREIIEGKSKKVEITKENIKQYLPSEVG